MKSETLSVQQLFQDRRQYRVPFYQRAYVWNKEDQWARLWGDIQDKADIRLLGDKPTPHFLGAAVLEPQLKTGLKGVETLHVIDGQQRLTTLQYFLVALAIALREHEITDFLPLVENCLQNSNKQTMVDASIEVFKLWPTHRDRADFRTAMQSSTIEELRENFPSSFTQSGNLKKIGIKHPPALEAIVFFNESISAWLEVDEDSDVASRAIAITESVLQDLNIVSISLGDDDDAQVIFETLNGHGAQLHATDLIRNFVFLQADRERNSADKLYDDQWTEFESDFWNEEQRRGRLKKPRIEWFFHSSLQAELGEEVDVGRLYVGYRKFAVGKKPIIPAAEQLRILREYSTFYRQLIEGTGTSPIAAFGRRITPWDASTSHPLALLIAKSTCSVADQAKMFEMIVSYYVRRAICGLTAKSYNKIFIQNLKALHSSLTPESLKTSLAKLEGDASRWPRDGEFRRSWIEAKVYPDRLTPKQATAILLELEQTMRTDRTEEPQLLSTELLDVEHILPICWYEHWPLLDGKKVTEEEVEAAMDAEISDLKGPLHLSLISRRETAKETIGNLTLLHSSLNRSLQNHGFQRKREEFFVNSNLHLNRELMQSQSWAESNIENRGRKLFEIAKQIWRGPTD